MQRPGDAGLASPVDPVERVTILVSPSAIKAEWRIASTVRELRAGVRHRLAVLLGLGRKQDATSPTRNR